MSYTIQGVGGGYTIFRGGHLRLCDVLREEHCEAVIKGMLIAVTKDGQTLLADSKLRKQETITLREASLGETYDYQPTTSSKIDLTTSDEKLSVSANEVFNPDWVSPPGDTIRDCLVTKGISLTAFAKKVGLTPAEARSLLFGEHPISIELATSLSEVLGSTPKFWITREAQYRENLAKSKK